MTAGGMTLFTGNVAASLISAAMTILVARLLGPTTYGLFSLSLVVPGILQLLPTLGLNVAATRYVAFLSSQEQDDRAKLLVSRATFLVGLLGLALSAAGFAMAGMASTHLLHRGSLAPYLRILSVSIMGQALIQMGTSIAIGRYAMKSAVVTNILQSGFKLLAAPLLIVAGFGLEGAIAAYAASFVVAAAFILVFLGRNGEFVSFSRVRNPITETGEMLRFAFPVFLGTLLVGASAYYLPIVLAAIASDAAIGAFQAAYNILIPLTLLSSAVAMTLLPAVATLDATGGDVAGAFRDWLRNFGYLSFPMVVLLAATSAQLMYLLYGASYRLGASYLFMLSISNTPVLLGLNITTSFFNGAGKTRITLAMVGLSAVLFLFLASFLSGFAGLGVEGLILALFISNLGSAAGGVFFAKTQLGAELDYRAALATLAASALAFGASALTPALSWASLLLVLKVLIFSLVYLTAAPLLGAISVVDLDRLGESFQGTPLIGGALAWLIGYEKRIARHSLRKAGRGLT